MIQQDMDSPRHNRSLPVSPVPATMGLLALLWSATAGCDEAPPPAPPCQGEATSCEQLTTRCELQQGCALGPRCVDATQGGCGELATAASCGDRERCVWVPGCVGLHDPCYLIRTAQDCDMNVGCVWSASANQCNGDAQLCEQISEARCDDQQGCYLAGLCLRDESCDAYSVSECESELHCTIGEGCVGEVAPCASRETAEQCEWHIGCTWVP
jgi:hypothetical protein